VSLCLHLLGYSGQNISNIQSCSLHQKRFDTRWAMVLLRWPSRETAVSSGGIAFCACDCRIYAWRNFIYSNECCNIYHL